MDESLATDQEVSTIFLPLDQAHGALQAPPQSNMISQVRRYGLALLLVVLAVLSTQALVSAGSQPSFGLFFLAALVGAWYGGLGPGIFTTLLSALAGAYFFVPGAFMFVVGQGIVQTMVFVLVGLLTTVLATLRRQAEGALREQREQYRVTLTSIGDAVIVTDAAGRVAFMNSIAEALTGWPLAEAMGQPLEEVFRIVNEMTRATVDNPVRRVIESGQIVGLANHTVLLARDGRELSIDDSAAPIKDTSGQVRGVVLVFRDITERRQDELERDRLYQAEQLARRTAEQVTGRVVRLQSVTAALSEALTPAQVAGVMASQANPALGLIGGSVYLLTADDSEFELVEVEGNQAHLVDRWRRFPAADPTFMGEAARLGRPILLESREAALAANPDLDPSLLNYGQAWAVLPLRVRDRTIGVLALAFATAQEFGPEDTEFLLTLASQCAQALDRARLYEAEQQARFAAQAEVEVRRQAEEQLQLSLQEKEVLLREVNHRVKNNLMGISNLLYLQAQTITDAQVRQKFEDTQNRIKSISLVHEKLYQTQNFRQVNFAEYTDSLVGQLVQSYRADPKLIQLKIECDELALGLDLTVTLGIIVNELVSNALKHAFPDNRPGEILIALKTLEDGRLGLMVKDNGAGFPEDKDLSPMAGSLGLQLVQMLTSHMQGTVELKRQDGTQIALTFRPPVEAN